MTRAARAIAIAAALLVAPSCRAPSPTDYTEPEARALLEARGFALTAEDLRRAVREDAVDVVAAFLAAGIGKDALDRGALPMAAAAGSTEILRLLLDAGADPNVSGSRRQPPLTVAVMNRRREAVELLLAAGADPLAGAESGTSAFLYAADVDIARRLLEAGADVDSRDPRGNTPLMSAALVGDRRLLDLLLEHHADPNALDSAGRSALLYASIFRFKSIRERLLDAGATPIDGIELPLSVFDRYPGHYAGEDEVTYQIVADPGRLLLIERAEGQLNATELIPLSATRFYRGGDPGAVIFEVRLDGERVTALAYSQSSGWVELPRIEASAV